ncbi:MAG: hypothetical protein WCF57_01765 [Pyrinomonadaceae bacterium]
MSVRATVKVFITPGGYPWSFNLPQSIYSRVVEEGLPEGEPSTAHGFRQAFDHTIQRTSHTLLPTAQSGGHIAQKTSGEPFPALAHRASDAATRLASGLAGRVTARPPLHTTYRAATPHEQSGNGSLALPAMRTDDTAAARCPATLTTVAAHQETFLKTCQKN